MALHELGDRELASIIAGLRALQAMKLGQIDISGARRRAIQAVANNAGAYTPLPITEIDSLCNRLNRTSAKKPDLYVVIEGGALSAICSDDPATASAALGTVRLIDYDTDGSDECGRIRMNGVEIEAHVGYIDITQKEIDLALTAAEFNALIEETP